LGTAHSPAIAGRAALSQQRAHRFGQRSVDHHPARHRRGVDRIFAGIVNWAPDPRRRTCWAFKGEANATFEIAIQSGAILAVVVAYFGRFSKVAAGLFSAKQAPGRSPLRNIVLGFVPAGIAGVLFIKAFEAMLLSPMTVAIALIIGGIAILWIEKAAGEPNIFSVETMPARSALMVGIGQCIAMIPGVSRSGATIMAAMLLKIDRKTAAEFSFFLAVPTIGGATVLLLWKNRDSLDASQLSDIAIGFGCRSSSRWQW
jgi:undecaprenyl-diphosphatase